MASGAKVGEADVVSTTGSSVDGAGVPTWVCRACAFDTDRLLVREWHAQPANDGWKAHDLTAAVVDIMTEPVTRALPPHWKGPFSAERAARWVADRDGEGSTLLVVERTTGKPAGLVILFEMPAEHGELESKDSDGSGAAAVDVRLGYMLAEHAWGKGLGTELVRGLVKWCRGQARLRSLTGGVERTNVASRRILEKCGFSAVEATCGGGTHAGTVEEGGADVAGGAAKEDDHGGEQLFTLPLHP